MDNSERLQKLKNLKIERHEGALFKSLNDCMIWIDKVAPLLKYDEDHYNDFHAHAQYVRITALSADAIMPHLNSMIGIVDQAIIELENNIESPHKAENCKLEYPEKVTLKWIWDHVPAKYY
jgi:flagellar biosynthesis chaperone FliJ